MDFYEIRPRRDIAYANHHSRSHGTEVRVYNEHGELTKTLEWTPRMQGDGISSKLF